MKGWKDYDILANQRFGMDRHFIELYVKPVIFKRDKNKCVKCGSTKRLELAHKRYGSDLTIKDFETLCKKCHVNEDKANPKLKKTVV